ncbi:polysaccharide deacetylase family protein [Salinimicrobium xinjiangense]|uniref:polysaccharide deacetylase family protein n=1 Tax=Salinimicrobium xinjiangense TaxID=438596 RepID=UPI0003FE76FB|nr:polysaccharide deacetylase family protein [Salinimicrobium xinjiangense]
MKERIPGFVKWIYPKRIWEAPAEDKSIYLTFDDGPVPQVTPWVLEQLKAFDAKATFFCIGENVQKHPDIFGKIIHEGHTIGNHTYNHLNGWKTGTDEYLLNTLKCQQVIQKNHPSKKPLKNPLFRPPYGKIKNRQAGELQKRGFKVVMWSIVSLDYDTRISPERCYHNVVRNARPGSVIVFHDSFKAEPNLLEVLPRILEVYSREGFIFKAL